MAKKEAAKKSSRNTTGKNATRKLPKHIAGIKIPKELRKSGGALLEKANSPVGREVIAAGITALVAAAARSRTGRQAANDAATTAAKAAEGGAQEARQIVDAIGTAATAVMQRLFEKKAG